MNKRSPPKSPTTALNFSKYDFIGFDFDHTLCTYNLKNLFTNHYNYMAAYMNGLGKYNIPAEITPASIDFISRGLIVDVEGMNLLKVTSDGEIVRACHGTKVLTQEDIINKYGKKKKWKLLKEIISSSIESLKSKPELIYSFMDFTDATVTAVYALAVDSGLPPIQVWADVIDALQKMYADDEWLNDILVHHELYLNKMSTKVMNWIRELKKERKIGLITCSYANLVKQTATMCMGREWESLFDFIVYEAKKPGFFVHQRPFLDLDKNETAFTLNGSYTGGCIRIVQETLAKELGKEPLCLYIGDSPYHDFFSTEIDYVAIVEEISAENSSHPSSNFLTSSLWGQYLFEGEKPTLIGKYALISKFYAPDVEYFADYPIDNEFIPATQRSTPLSS